MATVFIWEWSEYEHIRFLTDQCCREGLEMLRKGDFPLSFSSHWLTKKEVTNIIQDIFLIFGNGSLKDLKRHVHDFFLVIEKQTKSQK